ncbi:MAG TPA: citrate synthase family protein [Candidatus Sulfomarinibacteraceae bacterium]|nr:citrate synthase family protein [Candidatus Sulfomarinibacteraceae bacterium]
MDGKQYLTAREAAEMLGIRRATLYSYVSRGLVRSEPAERGKRTHRYHAQDVRRLLERRQQQRDPAAAAQQALHFGAPVLESSITLIDEGCLYYRGYDAVQLAQTRRMEEVASLIWRSSLDAGFRGDEQAPGGTPLRLPGNAGLTTVARFQMALPRLEAADDAAYDLRAEALARTGEHILRQLTAIAADAPVGERSLVQTLQHGWGREEAAHGRLLQAALILCADHELNVSSFTARCVASAGATPYQVVLAGLAALQGTRHGGHTARVAALLREVREPSRARPSLAARLRRGESIPGFGHPLYPQGDPRGRLLLHMVREAFPQSAAVALADAVSQAAQAIIGVLPTVDFGLAVLAEALDLDDDAPLTLFALGRTVGWIGQAIEQYESGQIIRPRARYVGPLPDA